MIVPEAGATLGEAQVIAWLETRLASYKVPRRVLFASEAELNLTGTAKIKPADARAAALRLLAAEGGGG
jgi:acyl-CoA synthetase (AMP-forming)/AMP-acid ligase II